jgi:hypothetical protein
MEYIKDLVPLLQTLSWIMLILILAVIYRKEARTILEKGGLKIGPWGLEIEKLVTDVRQVKNEVSELNERVSKQFLTAMNPNMYNNLYKLAHPPFGRFELYESSGLERELYFLRDIGYIDVKSIREIKKIGKGDDLSEYVKITEAGKKFVDLRESLK